jgi:hypothetical protein
MSVLSHKNFLDPKEFVFNNLYTNHKKYNNSVLLVYSFSKSHYSIRSIVALVLQ